MNGQAPFFKTVQEARRHALVHQDLWLNELRADGLYEAVADIFDEGKNLVGTIICPPENYRRENYGNGDRFLAGLYYVKAGTTRMQFMRCEDASLAPEIVNLDFMARNNKYRIPYKDGELPFTSIDEARAFLYRIFIKPQAQTDAGSPILDNEDDILGFVIKYNEKTVIFGNGRRWKEVRPNGRLGKAVNVRYSSQACIGTTKVEWNYPLVISKHLQKAQQ